PVGGSRRLGTIVGQGVLWMRYLRKFTNLGMPPSRRRTTVPACETQGGSPMALSRRQALFGAAAAAALSGPGLLDRSTAWAAGQPRGLPPPGQAAEEKPAPHGSGARPVDDRRPLLGALAAVAVRRRGVRRGQPADDQSPRDGPGAGICPGALSPFHRRHAALDR